LSSFFALAPPPTGYCIATLRVAQGFIKSTLCMMVAVKYRASTN
jgi:hypothetical protein